MSLIMVIEEEKDSCEIIQRVFKGQGHEVECFVNSGEARLWLETNTPDLAIVSAGKYGEKASDHLNLLKDASVKGPSIIMVASEGSVGVVRTSFENEVRGVFRKPSDVRALEDLISRVSISDEHKDRRKDLPMDGLKGRRTT